MAFQAAAKKAKPVILEPIMAMEIATPSEFLGDVLGDVSSRRANVQSMEATGDSQIIRATIPLAETFKYATHLRSLTTGRATFSMLLSHYEATPQHVAEEIIASRK